MKQAVTPHSIGKPCPVRWPLGSKVRIKAGVRGYAGQAGAVTYLAYDKVNAPPSPHGFLSRAAYGIDLPPLRFFRADELEAVKPPEPDEDESIFTPSVKKATAVRAGGPRGRAPSSTGRSPTRARGTAAATPKRPPAPNARPSRPKPPEPPEE